MFVAAAASLILAALEIPSATTGQERRDQAVAAVANGKLFYFPQKARAARVPTGKAVLDCLVGEGGWLADCKVVTEEPTGFDFGETALGMAPMFQMKPQAGQPLQSVGSRVKVPINFKRPS